jgi:acetyl-CoA synthetase
MSGARTAVLPRLADYDRACADFSWAAARRELDGLPGGQGLNIAHEAVDRHARSPHGVRVAFSWVGRQGAQLDATYADLRASSNRFANVLRSLAVDQGDRVYALAGRIRFRTAALGTPARSIFCPLSPSVPSRSGRDWRSGRRRCW